jgi:hypothetical protein
VLWYLHVCFLLTFVGQELRRAKEGAVSASSADSARAELAKVQDELTKAQGKIEVRCLQAWLLG